ncbi:alpha/beta-hydrolase [Melanomma pulvis-pyrius CBS 109.77]|uniref:Alpha/beta-hydrolase n=1 Tax=Melanomma pulvis-pyrius CBS 109.77 TaxID=1314802 RepID=A0A6A6XTG3_9PLEO|nr:alpha/beta-hydrolase [Melanomma pulvis-pyrius CBS 109.77]
MTIALFVSVLAALSCLDQASASSLLARHDNDNTHPSNGVCSDFTVTETVTSKNWGFAPAKFKNNFDVAMFLENLARKPTPPFVPLVPPKEVTTKEYTVSATFCVPKKTNGKEGTILVATSGLGYDGRYWASTYKPEEYSFVGHALDAGYSVFYYDRIGTGKSQKESGYVNQSTNQGAFLSKIVKGIRAGNWTGKVQAKKIILVGHSFGSYTSNALIAAEPDLVDGAVLTGLGYPNATDAANAATPWVPTAFAARIPSHSRLDTGYLAFGDIYAHTETFFHPPYSIPTIEYAQSISQPFAIVELISLRTLQLSAPAFKGKVLVTTGEFDFLVCGGECKSTYAANGANQVFSGAEVVETYLHPGAGHGINFAANATGFYNVITSFLDRNF